MDATECRIKLVDQIFLEAEDELQILLGREVTYEEVMAYLDARSTGVEDVFLKQKEIKK